MTAGSAVRYGLPGPDLHRLIAPAFCWRLPSFDYLVGAHQHSRQHVEVNGLPRVRSIRTAHTKQR
jgi:hypothetical protein